MRSVLFLALIGTVGCNALPPKLPPPLPAPPTGDSVLMFGVEVPSNQDAIRDAVLQKIPPGSSYSEVVELLNAEGFLMGYRDRRDGRWTYTVSSPKLMTSRWGMVQVVRVRFTEGVGPNEVTVGEAERLPESEMLEACPSLRSLPGRTREDAEALLRENGFTVRATTTGWAKRYTVLQARRWSEPSIRSSCAMLICRIEDGRIATVSPATDSHPACGFNGLVGMFPSRSASATELVRVYTMIPLWTAEMFGLGMLQWMFLPLGI